MQTIYYSTTNFIQHRGNLVDLDEFRWKLARARGEEQPDREEEPPCPALRAPAHAPRQRDPRAARRRRQVWALDACASLGVIVMNVSFGSSVALSFTLIGEGLVLCSSISLGVSGRFILIK